MNALCLVEVFVGGTELRGGGGGEMLRNDFLLQHARQLLTYEETITAMKSKPVKRERESEKLDALANSVANPLHPLSLKEKCCEERGRECAILRLGSYNS